MNMMTTAAAVAAIEAIEYFPLADLYLSPLNPRQSHSDDEILELAGSLIACGLLQNLSGLRDAEGRIGVIAGGRRFMALGLAAQTRPDLAMVPVRLAPDAVTAAEWALVENTARKDLHPADEIRAYGRMEATGASITAIASAFAVTEAHVRRRLKLAALPAAVLNALKAGQITLGHAAIFTTCNDEDLVLEVLETVKGRDTAEHELRRLLQGASIRHTDRRAKFVGVEAYGAEGGRITRDLFSNDVLFDDAGLLTDIFARKLAEVAQGLMDQGWKWAESRLDHYVDWSEKDKLTRLYPQEPDLSEDEAEEYDALCELANADALDEEGHAKLDAFDAKRAPVFSPEQRTAAGGFVFVGRDGELQFEMGFVRPADRAEAVESGVIAADRHNSAGAVPADAAPKSPYSAALVADIHAMRLAALQQALLAKPELVLDLMAFALSSASGAYATIFDMRLGAPTNVPSVEEGFAVDTRLSEPKPHNMVQDQAEAFVGFQGLGKKARNAVITEALARGLNYGFSTFSRPSNLFDHIEAEADASIRTVWTPTAANFFGRVSGGSLDALLVDLLSAEASDARMKAFAKMKKSEKAATMERLFSDSTTQTLYALTAEQIARIGQWVPDCL